jgi:hypothetical protein
VNRLQISSLLIAAVTVPAVAYVSLAPKRDNNPCFASGSSTYRIAAGATAPDFRIGFADNAADLRIQLVDQPEIADFVLVDDFSAGEPTPCRSATPVRTVALDNGGAPDVTVNLSADPVGADYRIYVHSVRYSQQDAAALLAAIWKTDQRIQALRADHTKFADRIKPSATMLAVSPAD